MARVHFDGVTKRFGDVVAVDDFTLHVADGEFVVLLGPSGCGKSTALRMIAGLDDPDTGRVVIGDDEVNGVDPKDRDVAMVFQSYALYPNMSVRKNIAFPLGPRGVPRAEQKRLVAHAAEQLGLTELLDRKPGQLSGGQRQRVALARAIVREPRVFLMDEPLSNLDAKLRSQTRVELVDLHRRLGTTFVYVTHDQVEAMTMADRIAIMDCGRLQQVAPPAEVYARPANLFVARFIGSPPMNTLAATVDGPHGTVVIGGAASVAPALLAQLGPGHAVVAGIRPEHLHIDRDDSSLRDIEESSVAFDGRVEFGESLGHEQLLTCSVGDERVVVRLDGDTPLPPVGRVVRLTCAPAHVHWFDSSTGARLDERRAHA